MGCVPDKTLARYKTFANQEQINNTHQQQYHSHNSHHLSVHSNNQPIALRPFTKVYRSCRKKIANSPIKLQACSKNPKTNRKYFSVDKCQWNSVEQQASVLKQEQRPHQRGKRAKGNTLQQPYRQHIITQIETPSQSIKTSFLSNLENHPSHFFLQNNTKDIDLVFRSQLAAKEEESTNEINRESIDLPQIHAPSSL